MGQTDGQTDKTTRWAFTAFEEQWELFNIQPDLIADWGWQTETAPDTGRLHYQGFIQTKRTCRFAQMRKLLPGVHLEVARNWNALLKYCRKTETAVPGTQVHQVNSSPSLTVSKAMVLLAQHCEEYMDPMNEDPDDWRKQEYWRCVCRILLKSPDTAGIWANPIYRTLWINTNSVWRQFVQEPELPEDTTTVPQLWLENNLLH